MTRVTYPYHIHFNRATLKAFKQAKIAEHVKEPSKKDYIFVCLRKLLSGDKNMFRKNYTLN